jgi:uncharacterized membrane protein
MLARRNNNGHLGTFSYYRADGILFSICCYLQHYYFNRLQLSARHYKMPAQQQAVDVTGNAKKSNLIKTTINIIQLNIIIKWNKRDGTYSKQSRH